MIKYDISKDACLHWAIVFYSSQLCHVALAERQCFQNGSPCNGSTASHSQNQPPALMYCRAPKSVVYNSKQLLGEQSNTSSTVLRLYSHQANENFQESQIIGKNKEKCEDECVLKPATMKNSSELQLTSCPPGVNPLNAEKPYIRHKIEITCL